MLNDDTALSDLTGIETLVPRLTGALAMSGCDAVTDLSALAAVTTMAGLNISANTGLTSLDLPALQTCNGALIITGNTSLPECEALGVQAQLTAHDTSADNVTGNLDPCAGDPCGGGTCGLDCTAPEDFVCN